MHLFFFVMPVTLFERANSKLNINPSRWQRFSWMFRRLTYCLWLSAFLLMATVFFNDRGCPDQTFIKEEANYHQISLHGARSQAKCSCDGILLQPSSQSPDKQRKLHNSKTKAKLISHQTSWSPAAKLSSPARWLPCQKWSVPGCHQWFPMMMIKDQQATMQKGTLSIDADHLPLVLKQVHSI